MSRVMGVNARTYPAAPGEPVNDPAGVTVLVVLVEGEIGDYAAYVGAGPEEWVARHGDKISFEEACVHFPMGQLHRERYRD